jgi:hypothetical protein
LTHKEKNLPLATFEGGNVTFKYWLYALTDMSPPSRPPGLDTDWGFTEFLDKIMKAPLFVAEAKRLGLAQNEELMKQIREREDTYLLFEAQKLKTAGISRNPGDEQVLEYFNSHPARGTDVLKIKQFWCQDLETAWKARLELDNGSDFDSVAKEYAVDKKVHALDVYPGGEGMFFDDLWKGKTTEVVGPVRGFKDDNVKWRIVIILEKHEGEPIEYSDKLKKHIQNDIWFSEKNEILDNYRMELLSVFPYKIYHENIIDPLNPP